MAKIGWGRVLAGVATVAAAGAAYVYLRQRASRAPIYQLLLSDGAFQIRRYPALLVIETTQYGSRDRALGSGFGQLAGYMFGEGRDGDELPITMPVLSEAAGKAVWRIRFLLPAGMERAALEPPGDGIHIAEIPARDVAVMSVPGKPGDRLFNARAAELMRWIAVHRRSAATGGVSHAYYNSPLEPGTAHPNEIWVPVNAA